ncbi:hypothetical protein FLW53_09620 [Microbispora sp. SCL1-1]|uniref:hypothetical protein n=1 Tax=unclassified Microbispora TaxID=2614687 RepID=UPI00115B77EA|nr:MULTISPECIES: hypothetical protein [unclassified Microbispora]NJP24462.1 hypothetical protein [Microbispora sp. CL1-1]TQS14608.1 hypothetical protein FLW53_09620 [Microbispora sp. SCL1-1]
MKLVRIVHPDGLEADVPESAVPQHRASGWELANPPTPRERVRQILVGGGLAEDEAERVAAAAYPDDGKQSKGAPAQSGASSSEDQSPQRRRGTAKDGE